ncbi:M13 family metallopeptidase [Mycoplasma buteonis]|uniref:M13 family metallopeptidase n=1 Tax=Mycoplasma buteonis TaxID=171280 RepID=UPI00055E5E50|nr:M13 family metallopeptidase [Mycoplasma buteonis]
MTKDLRKDDFYDYVNDEWMKKTKIPAHLGGTSSYTEHHLEIEKELLQLVGNWAKNKDDIPNDPKIQEMIKFFKMLKNSKQQEKMGWSPIQNNLSMIEEINSIEELGQNYLLIDEKLSWAPFSFSVEEDFIDNTKYTLWLSGCETLLPSKEYYSIKKGEEILKSIKEVATEYMLSLGKSKSEIKLILERAIKLDKEFATYELTSVEKNQIEKLYNKKNAEKLAQLSKIFKLDEYATKLVGQNVDEVIIPNLKYFENLDAIYTNIEIEDIKSLMYLHEILTAGSYLTPSTRKAFFKITQSQTGAEKPQSTNKWAYKKTLSYFSEPFSVFYGKTNFSEQARKDVIKMIEKIIDIYKQRLAKNNWLSKETIKKAIHKLDKIQPMVGYPDEIYSFFDDFQVQTYKQGGSLTSNMNAFDEIVRKHNFKQYKQKVNTNIWGMASYEVNAYFNPLANKIVFPAGYLQAPFYEYGRNSSLNYGGLGVTIGHEISHAFDNNGAQFDSDGSFNNWWTEQDYEAFKEKTQLMIKWFDQQETEHGKINGELTVSENIADQGGILVALEAAKTEQDYDIEKFFENSAYCEREKSRPAIAQKRLLSDPHSPGKARINLQFKICKDFQKHYKLTPEDKMYCDEKEIFEIW